MDQKLFIKKRSTYIFIILADYLIFYISNCVYRIPIQQKYHIMCKLASHSTNSHAIPTRSQQPPTPHSHRCEVFQTIALHFSEGDIRWTNMMGFRLSQSRRTLLVSQGGKCISIGLTIVDEIGVMGMGNGSRYA